MGVRFVHGGQEETIKDESEIVAVAGFDSQPATVTRGYGLTLNTGGYESARFDVTITMPCYPEDVDACDEWCRSWAEERIVEEAEAVKGKGKPKPSKAF